ncbi:roadblock/LC7 domain-containing protein [Streptomyces sp. NPDC004549]|uniref:roadblock/LC7 domain-containing protein n=1 Tax=unclassified Streptomyces TaxID=2593676 RepID=UPI0018F72799|nr:roadblock/LC7 domain-containing protein [Streptomyces sp. DSM 110735]MBJ7903895.1 roadblock/LC7 domain-containing protein [Streptomyces sp. DSM 110735]
MSETHANSLGWLLDEQLGSVEGVRYAVLVSGDGLLKARTHTIDQEGGEKLAALTASLRASAKAWDDFTGGGGVRQHLVECANNFCLTTAAGQNTTLMVCTTGPLADVGLITDHMVRLAVQLGTQLSTGERTPVPQRDGSLGA